MKLPGFNFIRINYDSYVCKNDKILDDRLLIGIMLWNKMLFIPHYLRHVAPSPLTLSPLTLSSLINPSNLIRPLVPSLNKINKGFIEDFVSARRWIFPCKIPVSGVIRDGMVQICNRLIYYS